ncbi:MAG: sigma 54-interacting transcriptional regulator, partial [Firmicutes bacterium]|nr:sigma 54-interacting transcriptional regulator [Bacillota bacterium]
MSVTAKEIMAVCRNIFDEVSDAICVCDLQGRLLYLNRAAEKLDGIDFALVRGRSVEDVYGVDPAASPLLKALRGGETVRESRFSYWINGREVVQSCIASPLIVKNEIVGAYSVQHDLTEMQRIVEENLTLQREAEAHRVKTAEDTVPRYDVRSLIGENAVFAECRDLALRAAESDSSVMLVGDTGSGKELFARAIHEHSHRKNGPFLALNCAAIPEDLLEGILFGTAKGVYTGAVEREGLLLQGQGGTIFLDEINSMPPASQAKLLRVLEERKVYKLGAAVGKEIDIRIISSTNELPASAVDRGVMRNDLFYRLSVVYIRIPSLAERKDDIPLLVDHFIE